VSPSPSPAANHDPIPEELRSGWVTDYREIEARPPDDDRATHLTLDAESLTMDQRDGGTVTSRASLDSSGLLVLETIDAARGCGPGVLGRYQWSVSDAAPVTLTLTAIEDPCAVRSSSLTPTWTREGCSNPDGGRCLGALPAGTFQTVRFQPRAALAQPPRTRYGGLTYTLPEGWASFADWAQWTGLAPVEAYNAMLADPGAWPDQIRVLARPAAMDATQRCDPFLADLTVGRNAADLVTYIREHPGITSSEPVAVTVGGRPGTQLDVDIADDWDATCEAWEDAGPFVPLFIYGWDGINPDGTITDGTQAVGLGGGAGQSRDPMRLIVTDLGDGDVAVVLVDSATPEGFEGFVERATPVVESLRIAG
jgi:hypothetical protein